MVSLENYLSDGANYQAQIVLLLLRNEYECILDKTYKDGFFRARINVGRFENCREQGYVFMISHNCYQKNYAVYEHRNSDNICVLINEMNTINTPTLDMMWEGKKDKYDVDKSFHYGQWEECARFIADDMKNFINAHNKD